MQHETFSEILNVSFGRYRTMSISTKLKNSSSGKSQLRNLA